jgi:hypothetical protein
MELRGDGFRGQPTRIVHLLTSLGAGHLGQLHLERLRFRPSTSGIVQADHLRALRTQNVTKRDLAHGDRGGFGRWDDAELPCIVGALGGGHGRQ